MKNNMEYIRHDLLEDLGFVMLNSNTELHPENYDWNFEVGYTHPNLSAFNLILVDYKNGAWHFAQRKNAYNGIGKMIWLNDLIKGFQFVTNTKLIKPNLLTVRI
jgi:hypothetical protein